VGYPNGSRDIFNKNFMKTAIQELQEWMAKNNFKVTLGFLDQLEYCKQKEKEQMFEFADRYVDDVMGGCVLRANEYFEKHYNQDKSFTYCQREIEGQSICDKQCEHCKEYYSPLENQNK